MTTESQPATDGPLVINFKHHGTSYDFTFPQSATLSDLSTRIETELSIPPEHQKFMITPKIGILKHPFPDPQLPLTILSSKKITLLAPTAADLASLTPPTPRQRTTSPIKPAKPSHRVDQRRAQDESIYTFHRIIPLPYLPNPSRSTAYLQRLAADPGIKAAMLKHKFRVGTLTEMNPAEHTTHDSKTLGLNRNRGEVIELRLRTDAYDGYRDYKVIRDTLCHELAHNVHGDHDRDFWELCKSIEVEVKRGDWTRGGQRVGREEYYDPGESRSINGEHVDGGGWMGGEYVLGSGSGATGSKPTQQGGGMGLRDAMARAAEERLKKGEEQPPPPSSK